MDKQPKAELPAKATAAEVAKPLPDDTSLWKSVKEYASVSRMWWIWIVGFVLGDLATVAMTIYAASRAPMPDRGEWWIWPILFFAITALAVSPVWMFHWQRVSNLERIESLRAAFDGYYGRLWQEYLQANGRLDERDKKRALLGRLDCLLLDAEKLMFFYVEDEGDPVMQWNASFLKWKNDVIEVLGDDCFSGSIGIFETIPRKEWETIKAEFSSTPSIACYRADLEIHRRSLIGIIARHQGAT